VISITSFATCHWLWRDGWKTRQLRRVERDPRLRGSKRDLRIKTLRRSKTDLLIKKHIKTERPNRLASPKRSLAAKHDRRSTAGDDARLDAGIVELFADKAKGWEFLTVLPDDALAQLRDLQRRSKLDRAALIGPWNRYGHLLRGRQEGGTGG
jgi:hypothetical protein